MRLTRPLSVAVALQLSLVCFCAATLLVREPTPSTPLEGVPVPLSGSFTTRLNHFDATNTEHFTIRFFYQPHKDHEVETSTDHVLVLVGGPWPISPQWLQSGLILDLATSLGNLTSFYVEHRFYGESVPTSDTTLSSLQFLSTDQVLGDLARFTAFIRSDAFEDGQYRNARVSLIGCSLGGSIATWMKLGYPHLVDTVVSDSGPLLAKKHFAGFLEIVSDTLSEVGGEACSATIAAVLVEIRNSVATEQGRRQLSTLFNTCSDLSNDPKDISTFYWYGIIETFSNLVLHAVPGEIAGACGVLTAGEGSALERFSSWVRSHNTWEGCLQTSYTTVVQGYQATSLSAAGVHRRLWLYQVCSQYGWQMTTDDSYFFDTISEDFFTRQCSDIFGQLFSPTFRGEGINRTNVFFGGLSKIPDHVVSASAGPWAGVCPGPDHQRAPLVPVYTIGEVGQCNVIRSMSESRNVGGLEHVHSTKQQIESRLLLWVRNVPSSARRMSRVAPLVLLAVSFFLYTLR